MKDVVGLLPGIMGSELWLGETMVWPGRLLSLTPVIGHRISPYPNVEMLLDSKVTAKRLILKYYFATQYQAIIDRLADWDYVADDSPPTLYLFPYDWRKPNEDAASQLAKLLDQVATDHRGEANVTLLAHSMGGLIARCYLESGMNNWSRSEGYKLVRRLITIGTPHRGAPLALVRLLGLEKVLWLSAEQVHTTVNHNDYPSAYQLLPPGDEQYLWDDDFANGLVTLNPFTPQDAELLRLNRTSLRRAQQFHAWLNPARRPTTVKYFCFSGTGQATGTHVWVNTSGAAYVGRKVEHELAGDGVVPFWSSTLPGVPSFPIMGEHSVLYKSRKLHQVLADLLGVPQTKKAVAGPVPLVDVSLRERVVERETPLHVTLIPSVPTAGSMANSGSSERSTPSKNKSSTPGSGPEWVCGMKARRQRP